MMLWVGLAAALVAGGVTTAVLMGRKDDTKKADTSDAGSTPAAGTARELAYFLTVQKWRGGSSYGEPFQLAQEMLFGANDKLRLTFTSPQSGHLYVINEGPDPKTRQITYNLVYPTPGAPPPLSSNLEVRIPPEPYWIKFDEAQGAEKLWLTFSAKEVAELEAAKGAADPRGVVSDPGRIDAFKAFFAKYQASPPEVVKDEAGKRTVLKASGDVLVSVVKLEHQ